MFKKLILSLVLILICFSVFAVKPTKTERKQIDKLLQSKNYTEAIPQIKTLLFTYPDDPEFNFMLGVCYFHTAKDIVTAIDQLEKAVKITKRKKLLIEIRYYLGRSYRINSMFEKAIDNFNALRSMLSARNDRMQAKVDLLIESSKYAKKMCANPVSINITSLGKIINSSADDHSPCISADERYLVFTSRRKGEYDEKSTDGHYYEDIYASSFDGYDWVTPTKIDAFSSPGHDASVSISADGRTMLIFRSEKGNKKSSGGDIYISYRMGNKWTEPEKLGGKINSKSRETHAAISPDGKTLYFSSDRPGGLGGLDIYYARKNAFGKWSNVKNIGKKINTKYDEQCPYMHIDGHSLYFSSNGHTTIGGLDIFVSTKDDKKWTEPKNLGYPINSLRDDVFFVPTADGKRAYFASARKGGQGGLDLYMMNINNVRARKLFVIRGAIGDAEKDLSFGEYKIVVRTKNKKERIYRADPVNGEYLFVIDADVSYSVDYVRDGYETMKTIVNIPYSYYNKVNHGIIPLQRVKLRKNTGEYVASDFAADLPSCGFNNTKELPEISGRVGELRILNLGLRNFDLPKVVAPKIVVPASVPVVDTTVYTVQVLAMTYNYPIRRFGRAAREIDIIVGTDGIYRYIYRRYDDFSRAKVDMLKMRQRGYKDAFVREYINGALGESYSDLGPKKIEKKTIVKPKPVLKNHIKAHRYCVQIKASRRKLSMTQFRGVANGIIEIPGKIWYRYIYKIYDNIAEAKKGMYFMHRKGYRDAFVRKIRDGKVGAAVKRKGRKSVKIEILKK